MLGWGSNHGCLFSDGRLREVSGDGVTGAALPVGGTMAGDDQSYGPWLSKPKTRGCVSRAHKLDGGLGEGREGAGVVGCLRWRLGNDGEVVHAIESGRARGRWLQWFLTTMRSSVGDQGGGEAAKASRRRQAPHGEMRAVALG